MHYRVDVCPQKHKLKTFATMHKTKSINSFSFLACEKCNFSQTKNNIFRRNESLNRSLTDLPGECICETSSYESDNNTYFTWHSILCKYKDFGGASHITGLVVAYRALSYHPSIMSTACLLSARTELKPMLVMRKLPWNFREDFIKNAGSKQYSSKLEVTQHTIGRNYQIRSLKNWNLLIFQ